MNHPNNPIIIKILERTKFLKLIIILILANEAQSTLGGHNTIM